MRNWANFCYILKFNLKQKNLAAVIGARFFSCIEDLNKLHNIKFFLVPPQLDVPRFFYINKIRVTNKDKGLFDIELKTDINDFNLENLVNKYLLISIDDAQKYLNINSNKNNNNKNGIKVYDNNNNYIGTVVSFEDILPQKQLIVKTNKKDIIIPYVEEIVLEENSNKIVVDMPDGLMELN